jgi:hypothetical protein
VLLEVVLACFVIGEIGMNRIFGLLAVVAVALVGCNSALPEAESGLARPLGVFSPTGNWVEPAGQVSISVPNCVMNPTMKLSFMFGAVAADGTVSGTVSGNNGVPQPFQGSYDATMGYLSGTVDAGNNGKAKLEAWLRVANRMRGSLEGPGGCIVQGQGNVTGTVTVTFYATFTRTSLL